MIIAVDGPAASGKGALARRLAAKFGYHYLDTGLLYRGVARDVLASRFRLDDTWAALAKARGLNPATLGDPALRDPAIGEGASIVARIPEVRAALLTYQRAFAAQPPGAVLDGRDIGTVVCPLAEIKIFVTAAPEVRARRRFLEIEARGAGASYEAVLAEILRRDARDAGRENAPMIAAAGAILLDTSALDIEAAFEAAVRLIERKIGQ